MYEEIKKILSKIKKVKPLILNITNDVTMDFIANGLLSVGASPMMSKAKSEMDDLLQLADAVTINLGTLDDQFISLCDYVCETANQLQKPIVLDPVGSGASDYRTRASLNLINQFRIAIIRANASEILSLSDGSFKTKGVDSVDESNKAIESARRLAHRSQSLVVMSGKTDVIVGDERIAQLTYGSPFMPKITGSGCLLSSVVCTFHAVEENRFDASVYATAFYGMCGEAAEKKAKGPASFKMQFLDALSFMPDADHD